MSKKLIQSTMVFSVYEVSMHPNVVFISFRKLQNFDEVKGRTDTDALIHKSNNIILTNLNTPPQSAFRTQPTIMKCGKSAINNNKPVHRLKVHYGIR